MTLTQILSLALQALLVRSVQFAVTVGTKHFGVTINQTGTPGNSGSFMDILQIVLKIIAGQPGSFTVGVFVITIVELVPAA